jgi:hypothetical protein
VKKGALVETDIDEGRLNSGKYRVDPAEIDVAYAPAMIGAIDQQFDQTVVFQDGDAGLTLASVDQNFTLQMRPQPPLELRKNALSGLACPPPRGACRESALLGCNCIKEAGLGQWTVSDESAVVNHRSDGYPVFLSHDSQSTSSPRMCRPITMRWISLVPSPISHTLASRIMRSTGYSVV